MDVDRQDYLGLAADVGQGKFGQNQRELTFNVNILFWCKLERMTIVLCSSSIVPLTVLVQTEVVHHQARGFLCLDVDRRLTMG